VTFSRFGPLLSCFLLLGCGPPNDQPVLGSVFRIEGSGTISERADSSNARALSREERFGAGDQIRVGDDGVAVLCLTPGIYLRCFKETYVRIEALTVSKDGNETGNAMNTRRASVRFEEGRGHFFLPAAGSSRADVRIDSRRGTLSARAGSLFSITLKGDSMRVLCARGELNWSGSAAGVTTIGAGYFSDRGSDAGGTRDPSSAADDASAQEEIIALLDSSQAIAELENAARDAPAPWRR
jgi:hypothetical protein